MKYKVTLNKRTYEVEVEAGKAMLIDEYEAYAPAPAAAPVAAAPIAAAPVAAAAPAAPAPAPAAAALAAGEVVKSPMPGNILKINVSQGQAVKEGDVLIVLEAMKMENEIVAPKAGSVAQIAVSKGQVVETGTPLVVIG
ncbi:MAG: biotin/lipoyl-binding protein [Oscillospiraceae bacterium]|nr:biotin/lipoyl-binding protein [Oscillospiraceae bacterium]